MPLHLALALFFAAAPAQAQDSSFLREIEELCRDRREPDEETEDDPYGLRRSLRRRPDCSRLRFDDDLPSPRRELLSRLSKTPMALGLDEDLSLYDRLRAEDADEAFDGGLPRAERAGTPVFVPFQPKGPLAVDRVVVNRGYSYPGEGAQVLRPGQIRATVHADASNFITREESSGFKLYKKYETHTLGFELRQGFELGGLNMEAGARLAGHSNSEGFLNGAVEWFERMMSSIGDSDSPTNDDRFGPDPMRAEEFRLEKNGELLRYYDGHGRGLGDVLLTAKALLHKGDPASRATRWAARLAANLATGADEFSNGNYLGAGVSFEHMLGESVALHGDVRATFPLDAHDSAGLALRRAALGGRAGLEFKLTERTSFLPQVDVYQTPFHHTGLEGYDRDYGAFSFGLNHLVTAGSWDALVQFFVRQNFEPWPFRFHSNLDPDVQFALVVTLTRR